MKTFKERYAELKSQHRCVSCTVALPEEYKLIRCEKCLEYSRNSHRRKDELKRRQKSYAVRPRQTTNFTISQVVKLAAERHVSYGEMVVLLENGAVSNGISRKTAGESDDV